MPKKTFFNLLDEKKEKIIECSKEEFSKYNFYDASINRIIKNAGISRGSFYQYFENKEDLYIYLLDSYRNAIIQEIKNKVNGKKYDVFELQLLVFDYITNEGMTSKDKEFIISAISNMDIKLGNHLMQFIKIDELCRDNDVFNSLISMENIKINNELEFKALHNLLVTSLTNQLVIFFNNLDTLDKCREELIAVSNVIKYGVIK